LQGVRYSDTARGAIDSVRVRGIKEGTMSGTTSRRPMNKRVVHTDKVPPARVPLSQAIAAGEWIFVSGQLGTDAATGKLVTGGIAAETRQVCENMKAILDAAGSSLDKVVRVVIYMADLRELLEMNEVFSSYFPQAPPARTTFQTAGLVAGARVEIEATAMA